LEARLDFQVVESKLVRFIRSLICGANNQAMKLVKSTKNMPQVAAIVLMTRGFLNDMAMTANEVARGDGHKAWAGRLPGD